MYDYIYIYYKCMIYDKYENGLFVYFSQMKLDVQSLCMPIQDNLSVKLKQYGDNGRVLMYLYPRRKYDFFKYRAY